MGFIRRNIFKTQTFIVFLLVPVALIWYFQNILALASKRKTGYEHFDSSQDYIDGFLEDNKDNDPDVFRLGSTLLRSGRVDGDDTKRKMKRKDTEVPIVFVDQHHEVIPYWYKAVEEGLISSKKNTLIHIDGHSDFISPDNAALVQQFITDNKQQKETSLLPLMQGNDRFIVSAVMTGLISRVIWIQPDWLVPNQIAYGDRYFVGTVTKDGKISTCTCIKSMKSIKKKKLPAEKFKCVYFEENDEDDEPDEVIKTNEDKTTDAKNRDEEKKESFKVTYIPVESCKRISSEFKYFVFSASLFEKYFNTSFLKQGKTFLDVDEDYFGVESGVKALVDSGIPLDIVLVFDDILPNLYCPKSIMAEQTLNTRLRSLFGKLSTHVSLDENNIKQEIMKETKQYFCSKQNERLNIFIAYIRKFSRGVLKALSQAKYCFFNSLRIQKNLKDQGIGFSLCHGTIFPEDTLNQIFVDSLNGIVDRTKQLNGILEYIFKRVKPSFFTIARSLRDGYTPRKQQNFIEEHLKKSLREITRKHKLKERFIYDEHLSFGKKGWKA